MLTDEQLEAIVRAHDAGRREAIIALLKSDHELHALIEAAVTDLA